MAFLRIAIPLLVIVGRARIEQSVGEETMQIGVHRVAMAAPNDVSELAKLIDSGVVKPSEIVALIGKTEGNGGANDFTRGYATSSYQTLLSNHLGIPPDEVGRKIAIVWSGG